MTTSSFDKKQRTEKAMLLNLSTTDAIPSLDTSNGIRLDADRTTEIAAIWTEPKEIQLLTLQNLTNRLESSAQINREQLTQDALYLELLQREVSRSYPNEAVVLVARDLCAEILPPRTEQELLIRVSVANLVNRVNTDDGVRYIGLLNRKQLEKGTRVYAAIGGAAEFTPDGLSIFQRVFEAEPQEGSDMRFSMPERYWSIAKIVLSGRNAQLFEIDPVRELA